MKGRHILILLVMSLVMGNFALPVFAEEYDNLDKVELKNIIDQKLQQDNDNTQVEIKNYLTDHTLDFLNNKNVTYFDEGCESKAEYRAQFEAMSSLIAENDNDGLENLLNKGYNPKLWIEIDGKKIRNLLTQAILSNNKVAIDIISTKIEKGLIKDLYTGVYSLLKQNPLEVRSYYNKQLEEREKELETPISSKDISNAVIKGDEIEFLVAYDLIEENADKKSILINAIYEVIDYRIAQGYN